MPDLKSLRGDRDGPGDDEPVQSSGTVAAMSEYPFVSIIMPVRNEARFIAESLGAVLGQDYPPERLEVFVADGMSSDETRTIVGTVAARRKEVPVRILENSGGIVPIGFNKALREARGDVLVRVDGHTVIAPDYVRECIAALGRSGADNVGGSMIAVSEGAFGRAAAMATSSPFGVGGARFHYSSQEEWVDTVYLGCWPRQVFERLGGFDEEMVRNQDDEFNYRLASRGKSPPQPANPIRVLQSKHRAKPLETVFPVWLLEGAVMQKHPAQMRLRHFAPACLVAVLLGTSFGALGTPMARRALGVVVGLYLAGSLSASLWAVRKGNWRLFPLLPRPFTIHLAYGTGFPDGVVPVRRSLGRP